MSTSLARYVLLLLLSASVFLRTPFSSIYWVVHEMRTYLCARVFDCSSVSWYGVVNICLGRKYFKLLLPMRSEDKAASPKTVEPS